METFILAYSLLNQYTSKLVDSEDRETKEKGFAVTVICYSSDC